MTYLTYLTTRTRARALFATLVSTVISFIYGGERGSIQAVESNQTTSTYQFEPRLRLNTGISNTGLKKLKL